MMNSELRGNVPLSLKWYDEHDFSDWLAENLDYLNAQVKLAWDIDRASVQREVSVWGGTRRVDLLCDATELGNEEPFKVVIENQLTETDQSHFARLMLYITAFDAKGAIWIASEVNHEWAAMTHWLNENSGIDVYLFTIELLANSTVDITVPVLTPIVGPGIAAPERGTLTDNRKIGDWWRLMLPKIDDKCRKHGFWQGFTTTSDITERCHAVPHPDSRVGEYIKWFIRVKEKLAFAGVCIPACPTEESYNYSVQIDMRKEEIEESFGSPLTWTRMKEEGEKYILWGIDDLLNSSGYESDEARIDAAADLNADLMERLVAATKGPISELIPYQSSSPEDAIK